MIILTLIVQLDMMMNESIQNIIDYADFIGIKIILEQLNMQIIL